MNKMIINETKLLINQAKSSDSNIIISDEIASHLPKPVFNWLANSGIFGKNNISYAYIKQNAQMKMKPEQKNWYFAEAEQYSSIEPPAFLWTVKLKMNPLMSIKGRDKFSNGKGEMLIKLNSLFNVVNEKGRKIDEGSLQRFLGEIVWIPSAALSPHISWESIDDYSAKATMDYNGTSGSGIFYFDEDGNFTKFSAMRFNGNTPEDKRYEWNIVVEEYSFFDGVKVPSKMYAEWKLECSDWVWLKLEIVEIKYYFN